MKIRDEVSAMSPTQRRRFLKLMGAALGASAIPASLRFAFNDMAGGVKYAQAQAAAEGTIFLEFNFRDQVDLMHMFVPPGLATDANLKRGVNGMEASLFHLPGAIKKAPNTNHYLTPDSDELMPHVDDIAVIDTGEAAIGSIHGHEAGNGIRSPGRVMDKGASGKMPMWLADGEHGGGSEELYTTTPTPAVLHSYHQKSLDAGLKNGFAFKGISRPKHSVYHFAAGLPGAEIDRMPTRQALFDAFPAVATDASLVPTPEQADLLVRMMKGLDTRLFKKRYSEAGLTNHIAELDETRKILHVANPRIVSVPLTPEEEAVWKVGVPNQQCSNDVLHFDCSTDPKNPGANGDYVKAHVWEQFAYASKILGSGVTRSGALEFDYMDLHGDGVRTEEVMQQQAQQCARPLARLIASLKAAGLWKRTLIAVYTLDGSRKPSANSYGDDGKGTLILAGGMIKGGYYGDIRAVGANGGGHDFGFVVPDQATGLPSGATVTEWGAKDMRTPSADLWLTTMKALQIPDELARKFPDVANGKVHNYMLKA